MTPNLERDGYTVLPGAVPQDAVRAALRCIGLGIRRHGLPGGQGHRDLCLPFAYLRVRQGARDSWAEPQILLRFPDEAPERPGSCDFGCRARCGERAGA